MGIRETFQKKTYLTGSLAGLALLIAVAAIFAQLSGNSDEAAREDKAFFSVDDGKTWFADSADKIPPFDHNGKPAVQAIVWTTDGGKTQFVSHLIRYTPEGRKRIVASGGRPSDGGVPGLVGPGARDRQVKRPGAPETAWVAETERRALTIVRPVPPSGAAGTPVRVVP